MKVATFIFINFLVSAAADIVLNDLANRFNIYTSLIPYFKNKSIIFAAFLAGLTVAGSTLILLAFSKFIFGYYVPKNFIELVRFLILSYPIGFIIDKIIEKTEIFGPTLIPFYKKHGSGNSGAIAFIISLFITFILQKYLVPLL